MPVLADDGGRFSTIYCQLLYFKMTVKFLFATSKGIMNRNNIYIHTLFYKL